MILLGVLQASKLSLHTIEDKTAEELPVLTPTELDQIKDANMIINKMITLETQCSQMKPNLGAIAEYRKKVGGYERACPFKSVANLNLGAWRAFRRSCTCRGWLSWTRSPPRGTSSNVPTRTCANSVSMSS